jgi:ABC-type amino acid transport substrate-binding protein
MHIPPFLIKETDNTWRGLSLDLWQIVAREIGVDFELTEYTSVETVRDDIIAGKVDIIPALAVTEAHERLLDFSHQYLRSGLAIAIPATADDPRLLRFAKHLLSSDFLLVMGGLLLLSLLAGFLIWLAEGHRNRDFGGGPVKGTGHGFWWAVVTLTTVGYGDKAPKTIPGRFMAITWMFASIFLIASFTAAITATMTVGSLEGKIRSIADLPGARVGALSRSEGKAFVNAKGISVQSFDNIQAGLSALAGEKIDALVLNEAILRYMSQNTYKGDVVILPETFDHYFVGMAMPTNSIWKERINLALLDVIGRDEWAESLSHYLGARP